MGMQGVMGIVAAILGLERQNASAFGRLTKSWSTHLQNDLAEVLSCLHEAMGLRCLRQR